ncbi:MAG: hypothetical protein EA384_09070 [Spirochaetaceae bacterium]|nr:MAG: hypothetical protein EA384_09070 [Spirochaetaceae bacterium]
MSLHTLLNSALHYIFAAVVLLCGLLLSACGELSMYDLLTAEEPGAFAMAQSELNLPPGAEYYVSAVGGFKPYSYILASAGDSGTLDQQTGRYRAPQQAVEARVEGEDRFGSRADTLIRVFDPLRVSPSVISVAAGQSAVLLEVTGGSGQRTLITTITRGSAAWVDPATRETVEYTPPSPADLADPKDRHDQFEIEDQAGNIAAVAVTLYLPEALRFDPEVAAIPADQSITLAVRGTFDTVGFEISPPYDPVTDLDYDDPRLVQFTPNGTAGTAIITVTDLSDAARTATATVHVIDEAAENGALTISPSGGSFRDGTTVEFTASGGVPPYTFERAGPGSGQPIPVGDYRARYTVSFPPGTVQIRLTDLTGQQVTAKLNVTR